MPSPEKIFANRKMYSEILLEQVKPFLTGKPTVWAREFGEAVSFSDALNAAAKAKFLPFGKSTMRTDCRVFHQLTTQLGDAFAVLHFSGFAVQPTDFIFILNRNIPRAAFLRKAKGAELTDKWATSLTENGEDDPFATYLTSLERKKGILPERPHVYANWVYHMGKLAVEVPYTMVLMPLGDGRSVFLFKRHYRPGFFSVKKSNFDVELVWDIAGWVNQALGEFNYQGEPTPLEVPVPAVSLIALPEIAPLFEYQGKEIPFEVNLSAFEGMGAPKNTEEHPPMDTEQETEKFCTQCGQALSAHAAFCSKCGAKQG